jgi:hypothetical protein
MRATPNKKEPQADTHLGFFESLPQYIGLLGPDGGVSGDGGAVRLA